MWRIIRTRFQQGHRTMAYPDGPPPPLPARFRGRPVIDPTRCEAGCRLCAEACPTDAISIQALETDAALEGTAPIPAGRISVDLGRCLFCTDCVEACPSGAITHDVDHRLASNDRLALHIDPTAAIEVAKAMLDEKMRKLFGRSLKLRQVSAGGCNGCEADTNVLGTVGWDIGRFGIQFVASPRHADGLFITGPVTENMRLALQKTWDAVPTPKIVIATGACAISGGPYIGHPEAHDGVASVVPVDLFIPGCPPHPLTILDGLLRMLGRIEADPRRRPR